MNYPLRSNSTFMFFFRLTLFVLFPINFFYKVKTDGMLEFIIAFFGLMLMHFFIKDEELFTPLRSACLLGVSIACMFTTTLINLFQM